MLVTVGPENQTGFRKHIEELAHAIDCPAKFISVKTKGPESLKDIRKLKPILTIIGGADWIKRNYKILKSIPNKKGILFVGPLGQEEISVKHMENFCFFMKLLEDKKIDYLFLGSKELAECFSRQDVFYLPAPFVLDKQEYQPRKIPEKNIVSILNDKAPHKNTFNSMAGISKSKLTEEFRVNGLPKVHKFLAEKFGLRKILKNVGFLSKKAFYQNMKKSKLILHLSYSEGLCYGALEALYRGVPVLITNAMPWFYHKLLYVENPSDLGEIAKKIDIILQLKDSDYKKLCTECRTIAERKINENNKVVTETLSYLLEELK